jgi:hypothetical protein
MDNYMKIEQPYAMCLLLKQTAASDMEQVSSAFKIPYPPFAEQPDGDSNSNRQKLYKLPIIHNYITLY